MKLVYLTEGGNSIIGSKICLNPSECGESGANRDYDSNGKVGQGALHPTINFWHNNVQTLTFFSSLSPCCRPYISAALCDRQSCRSIAAPRSMISISIFENLAIDDLDLDRDFSSDR